MSSLTPSAPGTLNDEMNFMYSAKSMTALMWHLSSSTVPDASPERVTGYSWARKDSHSSESRNRRISLRNSSSLYSCSCVAGFSRTLCLPVALSYTQSNSLLIWLFLTLLTSRL